MTKTKRLFWEENAACIENHRKHINTLRAKTADFLQCLEGYKGNWMIKYDTTTMTGIASFE